jgi:uncharacterized protein (DUF924 family)
VQHAAAGARGPPALSVIPSEARDILSFWFGDDPDDPRTAARQSKLWWDKDATLDAEIGRRFGALRLRAIAGELDEWVGAPPGRLALIVLVDQFSRNLFRNDPESFRHDALALRWALDGVERGDDAKLRPIERVFFYLPLQHSEVLAHQDRSVTLYEALVAQAPAESRKSFENFLSFAKRHREIVARFGRFPHRNAILGRASTPEEQAFLKQPGSSF